jgi:anthranilate phosphoribosyltransferase
VATEFTRNVLTPLVRGVSFERAEAREALEEILSGEVDDIAIAAFLTALTSKGETSDEMAGFVDALLAKSITFSVPEGALDIVGTGGDQLDSVNISTMASFAVAGTGVKVAKHGNRSASSSVGSADVLEGLGVKIAVDMAVVKECLHEANFGFMFAPVFHPTLGKIAPIRRALGFRTIFNVLGPLANPAQVNYSLIGVAPKDMLPKMTSVIAARAMTSVALVTADDGLDELSLSGTSSVNFVQGGVVREERIDASAVLGVHATTDQLRGGDVTHNVAVARNFLSGQQGPVFDAVCANAALALLVAQRCETLETGFAMARDSVLSGSAQKVLDRLVEVSNS